MHSNLNSNYYREQKENNFNIIGQPPLFSNQSTIDKHSQQASINPSQTGLWIEEKVLDHSENHLLKRSHDLKHLADSIYEKIIRDEVAQTFKQSNVTTEFFKDRVREVIEESLTSEKEQKIESMIQENTELKLHIE